MAPPLSGGRVPDSEIAKPPTVRALRNRNFLAADCAGHPRFPLRFLLSILQSVQQKQLRLRELTPNADKHSAGQRTQASADDLRLTLRMLGRVVPAVLRSTPLAEVQATAICADRPAFSPIKSARVKIGATR
jgi:hypothetical protein